MPTKYLLPVLKMIKWVCFPFFSLFLWERLLFFGLGSGYSSLLPRLLHSNGKGVIAPKTGNELSAADRRMELNILMDLGLRWGKQIVSQYCLMASQLHSSIAVVDLKEACGAQTSAVSSVGPQQKSWRGF